MTAAGFYLVIGTAFLLLVTGYGIASLAVSVIGMILLAIVEHVRG